MLSKWMKLKFDGKKIRKDQILILLLAGILLLVIAMPGQKKESSSDENWLEESQKTGDQIESLDTEAYVSALEQKLAYTLSQMDGAGNVTVMITLQSSEERVIEKDTESEGETVTETDSQGGERTTSSSTYREEAVYDSGNGEDSTPYVRKEISPQVEGVVVIAEGGDNAVVVKNITEAIQALFGIDTHKIRIVKGRRANQ